MLIWSNISYGEITTHIVRTYNECEGWKNFIKKYSNLKWKETCEEEEDNSSEHDHYLSSSPSHGRRLCLSVCHCAPRVSRHLYIGRQVAGDDGVQRHEDEQRQPEEKDDDGEEVTLGPGRVHVGVTVGRLRVVVVLSDSQHWRGEQDREQPRYEAHKPSLVLGPDETRSQR